MTSVKNLFEECLADAGRYNDLGRECGSCQEAREWTLAAKNAAATALHLAQIDKTLKADVRR